jgi:hypothetical protein
MSRFFQRQDIVKQEYSTYSSQMTSKFLDVTFDVDQEFRLEVPTISKS